MTQPQADFDKDEPLSPEAEAVMAKARRRAAFSMIIMLIGFMAVVLVVVYRLVMMGGDPSEQYSLEQIVLPAGAQVISSQAQDGMLTITYQAGEEQGIGIFDGETGEMIGQIAITTD